MTKYLIKILTLCTAIIGISTQAQAERVGHPQVILPKLHQLNMKMFEGAQAVNQIACDADVREYSEWLAADSSGADEPVIALAQKNSVNLNRFIWSKLEQRKVKDLDSALEAFNQTSENCALDKPFLQTMISAHHFAIRMVFQAKTDARSQELRTLLSENLDNLKERLTLATNLLNQKNGEEDEEEQGKEEDKEKDQGEEDDKQQQEQEEKQQNGEEEKIQGLLGLLTTTNDDCDRDGEEECDEDQQEQDGKGQEQEEPKPTPTSTALPLNDCDRDGEEECDEDQQEQDGKETNQKDPIKR